MKFILSEKTDGDTAAHHMDTKRPYNAHEYPMLEKAKRKTNLT